MKNSTKGKSKWPRKSLVVISKSPNLHMLLKELVRGYGWFVEESTESIQTAIEVVRTGRAFLIVVDDTYDEPAVDVIRTLNSDLVACATPILSFLLKHHEEDEEAIFGLGRTMVVEKPLTPAKFSPGFRNLVELWESRQHLALRMAVHQFVRLGDEMGHNTMKKLIGIDSILPQVAQVLSIGYRQRGSLVDAEKILLYALKRTPKNLGLMLALGELYLHSAMPKMAIRLFKNAQTQIGQSVALLPDLVQASLAIGDFQQAAEGIRALIKREYKEDLMSDYLARVLFADGRDHDARDALSSRRGKLRKIEEAWTLANADTAARSA